MILPFVTFIAGGMLGLFVGCAFACAARFDLMDDLEEAEADIDALRRRG